MRDKLFISFVLFLIAASGFGQNFTNKGREFWVGYGHHQYMEPSCDGATAAPNNMNMVLYLSAEEPAIVKVTIDSSGSTFVAPWTRTYTIPAYTVISTENLPKGSTDAAASGTDPNYDARLFDYIPPIGSGGENLWRKKGIHIESNVPIVAYAHIYGGVSSGATMLMPVNTWGYTYTSVNSEQGGNVAGCYSWMYVIAKENNTRVQITPSTTSRRGKPAGVPFTMDLQKGQIYQLVGNADCQTGTGAQLTGSTVKSVEGPDGKCHPVGVFGGSSRTAGEASVCGSVGRDNDMQQLFPEAAWGKRYATTPFSKASGSTLFPSNFQTSVYKVVVKDPATIVKRNGVQLTGLIGGKYYKFTSATADYIVADKPVMVAQFMGGGGSSCNTGTGTDGDPEMVIISPIEQAIKQVGFYRNTKQSINSNYLTLVVPTAGISSLRIDNSGTFNYTYPHPNLPGYTVVVKGWAAAQSQCLVRCDSSFTAITYGLGSAESYGYNAGTYINNLSAVGAIRNTYDSAATSAFTCTRTPVELSVLMAYQPLKMEWLISTLSPYITPNNNVTVNTPVVVDSPLVNGIKYYKYSLPGSYQFSDTGTYNVRIVVTSPAVDNCTQSDTVGYFLTVKGKPIADFTYTHSGCYTDTVYFTGNGTSANYNINRWRWEFPTNDFDSTRYPKRVFPVGTHTIKLRVISQEGCLGDTVRQIVINGPPATDFAIVPGTLCQPSNYSFNSATPAGTGVSYYWDFGNGITSSGTTNPVSATYPNYGTYTIKHVAKQTGQCPSDTTRKTITVYAKPLVNFGFPRGCLAPDGTAQFSDSTINPDGQTLTYAWNFGDANATVANPNISTAQNPTHKYTAFGTYNIRLTVTTNNGCSKDTTIAATFAVRPTLIYAPLTSICASSTLVSVARGSVTNGVPGMGFYKGPGTDSIGSFNPSVAGAGIKTIWYIFTSSGGCTDSVSQIIRVFPKPVAAFSLSDTSFCQNATATITPASTISSGTITQWKWDFDTGTVTYTNNNPFTRTFNRTGPQVIRLYNISDSSCVSDTVSRIINVNPLPGASFGLSHTGCRLDTIYLTGSGSTPTYIINSWKWNFSNGDSSLLQNPHILLPVGSNTIRLRVTTPEGCSKDTVRTITVFAPPVAGFTSPSLGSCEPATINFTDASNYGGSGVIIGSYWDFGNGQVQNNTTNNGVSNLYPAYGTYTVKHTVKVSDLCISDTARKTVRIYAKPRVSFTYPQGCLQPDGTAQFTNTTTVPDNQNVTYSWDFGDAANATVSNPNTSTQQSPLHRYIAFGAYSIKLSATTANGCTSDTTINVTFSLSPTLSYTALNAVCVNGGTTSVANASVTNNVPGTGYYRGPGTDAAGTFNAATAGTGTHTIWYVYTTNGGCTDSISRTITVKPAPTAAFAYPTGCLGPNGLAQFTNTSTAGGAGTLSYSWNFGDALSNGGNPNTSTQQNPSHLYSQYGSYTIQLTVNAADGCSKDTSVTTAFYLRPVLSYPVLTGMCVNGNPVSVASALVTNGVPGRGKYRGPGTDTTGLFNPAIAGAGVHTIWYVYQTPGSCNDSVSQTIRVFPKPIALFNLSQSSICTDSAIIVAPQSSVSAGTLQSWNWDFGNRTAVYQNGNSFNLNYAPGTYTIQHYVISDNSCVSDTATRTVVIHPLPMADFTLPASICMPEGKAQFTNQSTVADGTALNYSWNFGDQTPAVTTTNPLHIYGATGPYDVTLRAITIYGCKKDTTKRLATFYAQPVANFNTPTELCQGTTSVFTDNSIAPGSSISGWEWTFGDNSTATQQSPFKRYVRPGNYDVTLVVKSRQGCVSDTFRNTIRVFLKPYVDAGPSFLVPEGTLVKFAALATDTSGAVRFRWTPGNDLNNDALLQPTLLARSISTAVPGANSGSLTYTLTATGEGNCTATDTLTVRILRKITIPNAFSPNGDGVNDTWVIPNFGDYPGSTLEVYDRYGTLILRTTGYARPWDGTLNSKPVPIGTYYYVIDLKNGFAPMNGPVTIIR